MSKSPQISNEQQVLMTSLFAIASIGALGVVAIGAWLGLRAGLSVGIGAATACLNLWSLGFLIRRWLQPGAQAAPWAVVTVLKFGVLIGLLYALVASGVAQPLPLILGFGALPLGIVAGQLGMNRAAREEG